MGHFRKNHGSQQKSVSHITDLLLLTIPSTFSLINNLFFFLCISASTSHLQNSTSATSFSSSSLLPPSGQTLWYVQTHFLKQQCPPLSPSTNSIFVCFIFSPPAHGCANAHARHASQRCATDGECDVYASHPYLIDAV